MRLRRNYQLCNMRIFVIAALLLLTGLGCTNTMENTNSSPLLDLPPVGKVSEATMLVGYAYTGGMGSMPVLTETGEVKTVNNLPVYFDESYQKKVSEQVPECYEGTPLITVHATVTLEERKDINTSIPGAPEEKYYMAVVKNLGSIEVKTQPCTE